MKKKQAYYCLVKLLSSRDYSEFKLREKLRLKGFQQEEAEDAISEIKNLGYLKEGNYILARITAFMKKGYAPSYIEQKLKSEHLNVSQQSIQEVFADYGYSEEKQIQFLIEKKLRGNRENKQNEVDVNKVLRFLLSKGHNFSKAMKILKDNNDSISL